jgi:hypothetical protein
MDRDGARVRAINDHAVTMWQKSNNVAGLSVGDRRALIYYFCRRIIHARSRNPQRDQIEQSQAAVQ